MNSVPDPSDLSGTDITTSAFKANPFPFYARLRAEAPVFPVTLRLPFKRKAWLVTRYADAQSVLKDERFVKNPRAAMTAEQWRKAPKMPPIFHSLQRNLLSLDKPDHTRLRAIVQRAFTPRRIEQIREQTQAVSDELLHAARRKGRMDLIAEYALPLPLTLIGRILGVPARDNPKFHRWTRAFISAGHNPNPLTLIPIAEFMGYLRRVIRTRRANPADDLITALVQAGENDPSLTDDEILSMIFIILSAGHETTLNLIANGTLALIEHPEQWERLRHEPSLDKTTVEETLRFAGPIDTATERYAREDIEIAGVVIPRGEMALAVVGSANRDADVFADPDTLDIGRADNHHLTFGQGAHYCLGASLARMEAQVAFRDLTERLPRLQLAVPPDRLRWHTGMTLRGLTALPVTF